LISCIDVILGVRQCEKVLSPSNVSKEKWEGMGWKKRAKTPLGRARGGRTKSKSSTGKSKVSPVRSIATKLKTGSAQKVARKALARKGNSDLVGSKPYGKTVGKQRFASGKREPTKRQNAAEPTLDNPKIRSKRASDQARLESEDAASGQEWKLTVRRNQKVDILQPTQTTDNAKRVDAIEDKVSNYEVDLAKIENSYDPTDLLYKDITSLISECRRLHDDHERFRNETERYQRANDELSESNRIMRKRIETLNRAVKEYSEKYLTQYRECRTEINRMEELIDHLNGRLKIYEGRRLTLTNDELFYIGDALTYRLAEVKQTVGRSAIDSNDYRRRKFIITMSEELRRKVNILLELANSNGSKTVSLHG
jgi:hypothetical protein